MVSASARASSCKALDAVADGRRVGWRADDAIGVSVQVARLDTGVFEEPGKGAGLGERGVAVERQQPYFVVQVGEVLVDPRTARAKLTGGGKARAFKLFSGRRGWSAVR
ncbi:hypothetical protein [Amycolatopsis sp. MEPSY49]|uniref:hypothetical protein n=1 Tax=Amycolatopsis sp. MEPSY49 TaxID=3151600 RepID=UPI003EF77D1A